MSERRRVSIPFGPGLSRETGVMAAQAGTMEDLRNVYLRNGKLVVRKGVESNLAFTDPNGDPITHVLAGQELRGERLGIAVGYQGDDTKTHAGEVFIYRLDASATVQNRVSDTPWFTVNDPANDDVPRIVTAESKGRVAMAHDEYRQGDRAPTLLYDPYQGNLLTELSADLDGDGNEGTIKFRGVESHLDYLFGWGYGSETEDRAELVRVSLPGDPTTFRPEHYFIIGSRRDPTLACVSAGGDPGRLIVLKEAESHVIRGSGYDSWGSFPADERFGIVGARLAVSVEGTVLFWSSDGPRMITSGPSQMISQPLELKGFEPSDLPSQGDVEKGFASYIPEEQTAIWVFGQRVYALTLRGEKRGWSYWDLGFTPQCGFTLYAADVGSSGTNAPAGHPEFAEHQSANEGVEDRRLKVYWLNFNEVGDEWVEVWLRPHDNLVPDPQWEMERDDGGNGVANGFTSNTSSAGGSSFSIAQVTQAAGGVLDKVQKVALVSDGGVQGRAEVYIDISDVSPGDTVRAAIEAWLENVTDAQGVIREEFYNASDTLLDSAETTFTGGDADFRDVSFTAPANTDYVRVLLQVEATAADGTADGFFSDLLVHVDGDSGDWKRWHSTPVETTDPQTALVGSDDNPLGAGQFYEVALRYRRSIFYTSGYEGDADDVDGWPDVSKGVGKAGASAPSIDSYQWVRDAKDQEAVELTVSIASSREDELIEAENDGKSAGIRIYRAGTAVKDVAPSSWSGLPAEIRDDTFASDNSDGEQQQEYYVTTFIGAAESQQSNTVTAWIGPEEPYEVEAYATAAGKFNVEWRNGIGQDPEAAQGFSSTPEAVIYTRNNTQGESQFSEAARSNVATDEGGIQQLEVTEGSNGDDIDVMVRHELTIFQVTDESTDSGITSVTIT